MFTRIWVAIRLVVVCLSVVPARWACAQEGLVGYWPLDEGTGRAADDLSGYGNAGYIRGEAVWEDTERGQGLRFNGKDTTVQIPDHPAWNIGRGEMTITLWVKLDQGQEGAILEREFGGTAGTWQLTAGGGRPYWSFYDDQTQPRDIRFEGFTAGTWQHLALVWKRDTNGWIRTYVNGKPSVLQEGVTCTAKRFADLFLGSMRASYTFFPGNIREVAIFSRILSDAEIARVCQEGIRLPGALTVSSVTIEKVFYDPTETAAAQVRVRNLSDGQQTADLVVVLRQRLDDEREAFRKRLDLAPRAGALQPVRFGFKGEDYGCGLIARLEQQRQTVAHSRAIFSVSDNLWKVCLGGGDIVPQPAVASQEMIDLAAYQSRRRHINWYEQVFWAPEDWGEMTPAPGQTWLLAQGRYANTEKIQYEVQVASPRPVWWEDFVNEQVVSPTRHYVIVNLLNPPVHDKIPETKDELPEPMDGVEVTSRLPTGERPFDSAQGLGREPVERLRQAWLLAPGSPNRAERLAVRGQAEQTVAVPRFDTWAMVVWELDGRYTPPPEPPRFAEPLTEAEQAEIVEWETKRVKIAVADNLSDPTPQHDPAKLKPREWKTPTVQKPDGLTVGGEPGLDILVLTGLHHYAYRIPDAITTAAPAARVTHMSGRPNDLPEEHTKIHAHDVIVLADYGDGLTPNAHRCLADFVADGGRLVVLGGIGSLAEGYYADTPVESVLPVAVRPARDIYRLPRPLPLRPTNNNKSFPNKPLLYCYHAVEPRDDAQTHVWAGKLPVLFERRVGKGESLVFIGTALGEARTKNQMPFWEWDGWPAFLGKIITGGNG